MLALHFHPPPATLHIAAQIRYQLGDLLRGDPLPFVTLAGVPRVNQPHHHRHVGILSDAYVVVRVGGYGERARAELAASKDGTPEGDGGIAATAG